MCRFCLFKPYTTFCGGAIVQSVIRYGLAGRRFEGTQGETSISRNRPAPESDCGTVFLGLYSYIFFRRFLPFFQAFLRIFLLPCYYSNIFNSPRFFFLSCSTLSFLCPVSPRLPSLTPSFFLLLYPGYNLPHCRTSPFFATVFLLRRTEECYFRISW